MASSTLIVDEAIGTCFDQKTAHALWQAWRTGENTEWPTLSVSVQQQLGQWVEQFLGVDHPPPMSEVFDDLGLSKPSWLETTFPKDGATCSDGRPAGCHTPTSLCDLCQQIQLLVLEELARRHIFWRRDDDRKKVSIYNASVNYPENRQIEIIQIREFLNTLDKNFGPTRRAVFQAKTLGYTYQEIADSLQIGKGSVRHHWDEARDFFLRRYWKTPIADQITVKNRYRQ